MTLALDIRGVTITYANKYIAVRDVTLPVERGEIHALLGPNGAGKTTLFKAVSREVQAAGSIKVFDEEITQVPGFRLAEKGVGRTCQIGRTFLSQTVAQNVLLSMEQAEGWLREVGGSRFCGALTPTRARINQVRDLLAQFGIEQFSNTLAVNLSHGTKKTLELAMAVAQRPKLLLLDEPLAGMSKEEVHHSIELLQRVSSNATILLTEHNMDAVFALATRISVLVRGELLVTGRPEEVRTDARVKEAYLGSH